MNIWKRFLCFMIGHDVDIEAIIKYWNEGNFSSDVLCRRCDTGRELL